MLLFIGGNLNDAGDYINEPDRLTECLPPCNMPDMIIIDKKKKPEKPGFRIGLCKGIEDTVV